MICAIVGLFLGCAAGLRADMIVPKPYAGHPLELTVLLDTQMGDLEVAYTIVGFDAWATSLPKEDLVLHYGRITHVAAAIARAPEGWVYVVRRDAQAEVETDCGLKNIIGCFDYNARHIYIAFGDVGTPYRTALATHELGHALGLPHCSKFVYGDACANSIMAPTVDAMRGPSHADVVEFCRLNGCAKSL